MNTALVIAVSVLLLAVHALPDPPHSLVLPQQIRPARPNGLETGP
jgi:hypothetical protein